MSINSYETLIISLILKSEEWYYEDKKYYHHFNDNVLCVFNSNLIEITANSGIIFGHNIQIIKDNNTFLVNNKFTFSNQGYYTFLGQNLWGIFILENFKNFSSYTKKKDLSEKFYSDINLIFKNYHIENSHIENAKIDAKPQIIIEEEKREVYNTRNIISAHKPNLNISNTKDQVLDPPVEKPLKNYYENIIPEDERFK